jgi:DeoR/GlpR family transcriptional regulator of sugar metabolism
MDGKSDRLTKQQRQERIVAELRISPTIRASEIAAKLGVHTETVRRDLKYMDRNGLLNRTYGGAAAAPLAFEPGLAERDRILVTERRSIGERAAGLIDDGDVLMIDAGSTTIHFCRELATRGQHLTVLTNSHGVAAVLARTTSIRVLVCPGEYDGTQGGVSGPDTIAYLTRFHANTAVIGAGGLGSEGPSEFDPHFAAIKRAMLARARRRMLLVDHSKFNRTMLDLICPLRDLSDVIVDRAPSGKLRTALNRAGVTVHGATSRKERRPPG